MTSFITIMLAVLGGVSLLMFLSWGIYQIVTHHYGKKESVKNKLVKLEHEAEKINSSLRKLSFSLGNSSEEREAIKNGINSVDEIIHILPTSRPSNKSPMFADPCSSSPGPENLSPQKSSWGEPTNVVAVMGAAAALVAGIAAIISACGNDDNSYPPK